ncbi:MAG: HIRAN domain-containing protein [Bacteroidia bacterium]|nr:HIRAN domain-containing protein [Bacteroidia bacterium]
MDRATFLRIIGASAGSFLFSGLDAKIESLRYDLKQVKIYDNYVRGVHFRKQDFLDDLPKVNDTLQLERETDNPYDQFAIKVMRNGKFLGYIAAYENITLAMLMDQGVQLEASVSAVAENIEDKKYLDKVFSVQVFTKLLVPYTHLETTDLRAKRADDADDVYRKGGIIK